MKTFAAAISWARDSLQRAAKVRDQGAPELVLAVEQGRVSVSAADVAAVLKSQGYKWCVYLTAGATDGSGSFGGSCASVSPARTFKKSRIWRVESSTIF